MYRIRLLLERQADVESDRLAPGFGRPSIRRLHDPRTAARGHHKPMPPARKRPGPARQQTRQRPGVFVKGRHVHRSFCQPKPARRSFAALPFLGRCWLVLLGRRLHRARVLQQLQLAPRHIKRPETRRPEKHHRVLDALAPEARHRLLVLGQDTEQPAIRRPEKLRVLVRERSLFDEIRILLRRMCLDSHMSFPVSRRGSRGSARPRRSRSRYPAAPGPRSCRERRRYEELRPGQAGPG